MKRIYRFYWIFLLIGACLINFTVVNAAYTKMWWEYLDDYANGHGDTVYVNSNNILCVSELDGFGELESTINILSDVKKVKIIGAYGSKAVLMQDGTLYNWGDIVFGNDGIEDNVKVPQVVLNDVVDIDSGVDHVGALTNDGVLYGWGYSMFYDYFHKRMQLDDFIIENVKQFEIDNNSFAILKNDSSLWIFGYWSKDKGGYEPNGIYEQPYLLDTDVKQIDLASGNLAYVKNDGSLWMIGSNDYGELATPRALLEYTLDPIKIMNDVECVSLSTWNTMILKKDGTVYSVGYTVQSDVPTYIDDNIVAIDFPYIWKRDGSLLKLTGGEYSNHKVINSPIDVKMPDNIYKPILVNYNGNNITFDQQPIIENGRTLVPLRAIFEALGATVSWDDASRSVTATKDSTTMTLTINSNLMYLNGKEIKLDVPAKLVNNRTLVPVRVISESFGYKVNWDEKNLKVSIVDELEDSEVSGKVVEIEILPEYSRITIVINNRRVICNVTQPVKVTINNKESSLYEVRLGDNITITKNNGVISKIEVTTN